MATCQANSCLANSYSVDSYPVLASIQLGANQDHLAGLAAADLLLAKMHSVGMHLGSILEQSLDSCHKDCSPRSTLCWKDNRHLLEEH